MSYENIIYEGQQILDCLDYDREMITGSDYEKGYENLQENEDSLGYSDKERWCRFKCDMECIDALDSETQDLLTSIFESPDNLCSYHLNMLEKLVDCKYSLSDTYQNAIEQTQKKLENYKEFKSNQLQGVREILEKLERDSTLSEIETVALAQHTKGYCERFLCDVAEKATKAIESLSPNFDYVKREHPESHIASEAQTCLVDTKLLDITNQTCEAVLREHDNYRRVEVAEASVEFAVPDHPTMLNATIRAIKDKATELYQTSQDGEIRFTKKGDIRDHQGDDYSLRGNLGAIIHRSDREAIVISVNREYGTRNYLYHPDSSGENTNQVTIAYPARLEDKELAGIYVTTYRHMNRIPNNLNIGDTLTGGEILGDYRIIVAESILPKELRPAVGEYKDIPIGKETYRIINGSQDNYGYDLDGDQFFVYDTVHNQVQNEHLHIEKRYLQGERIVDILKGGIDEREGKILNDALIQNYNRNKQRAGFTDNKDKENLKRLAEERAKEELENGIKFFSASNFSQTSGEIEIFTRDTPLYNLYMEGAMNFLNAIGANKDNENAIIRDIAALHAMCNVMKQAKTFNPSNPCYQNQEAIIKTLDKVQGTVKTLIDKIEGTDFQDTLKDKLDCSY